MVAVLFVVINLVSGIACAHSWMACFPITAGVLGTVAIFALKGASLRAVLLVATICWLINNIATGSFGGVALESFNALANGFALTQLMTAGKPAENENGNSIASSYPGFESLPRGLKQLLLRSEDYF